MQKASFSNYGDKVRYAFPGVNILSAIAGYDTDGDGIMDELCTDGYAKYSGISMSSPVAAGVAAVTLEYATSLGMLDGCVGSQKVDKLLEIMDSACLPLKGEGLGKGVVSLSKVIGAKTYEENPNAPYIMRNGGSKYLTDYANIAKDKAIEWLVADEETDISVSKKGVVKVNKNAEAGEYIIIARMKNNNAVSAESQICVEKPSKLIDSITSEKTQYTIGRDEDVLLETIKVNTKNGSHIAPQSLNWKIGNPEKQLKWTSSDPDIIKVDQKGKITAVAYEGYAIITAESETYGISYSILIFAVDAVKKSGFSLRMELLVLLTEVLTRFMSWQIYNIGRRRMTHRICCRPDITKQ